MTQMKLTLYWVGGFISERKIISLIVKHSNLTVYPLWNRSYGQKEQQNLAVFSNHSVNVMEIFFLNQCVYNKGVYTCTHMCVCIYIWIKQISNYVNAVESIFSV